VKNQMKDPQQPGRAVLKSLYDFTRAAGCLSNSGCWFFFFPSCRKLPWKRGRTYRVWDMSLFQKENTPIKQLSKPSDDGSTHEEILLISFVRLFPKDDDCLPFQQEEANELITNQSTFSTLFLSILIP
jgi:hypothetical protein